METLFQPARLGLLAGGVLIGLFLGVVPGVGGLVGLTLLLPFTFSMDPFTAMAFMMGLAAVGATSDAIPAILFGVPGGIGSAATVLDGYPMARRGEAGRALGAAFAASVLGGLFGAILLAFLIPAVRPAVLSIAKPEMLAVTIFGISLAASLSGNSPVKGLMVACAGLLLATVGEDDIGELRWIFDTIYLYDGIPIIPITLGLFALPEIADLMIQRSAIAREGGPIHVTMAAQWKGFQDTIRNWFLVLRCSALGSILGAIPGIGAPVIDWVAYAHATRTEKGARETFGKGDVRGVLASESSNNAKEGGSLVPTIAFGIPGSASMVLFLAALLYQGVVPGPGMLGEHLDVTYTLVWSIALANVLACGICFVFANQIARIALVRIGLLAPCVLVIIYLGAFEGKRAWGDLYVLLAFGVLGFVMKRLAWPRSPMILGVVLGQLLEANAFITANVYGWSWMTRPITATILLVTLFGLGAPIVASWRRQRALGTKGRYVRSFAGGSVPKAQLAMAAAALLFFGYACASTLGWEFRSYLMPRVVAGIGLALTAMLFVQLFVRRTFVPAPGFEHVVPETGMHMDFGTDFGGIDNATFWRRLFAVAAWCVFIVLAATTIGLLPACALFMLLYLKLYERESWATTLLLTGIVMGSIYVLFHLVVHVTWAPAWLGDLFTWMRSNRWLSLV
nr:tripartite tricarboxylate transporter permease [Propylenella binzhouense]